MNLLAEYWSQLAVIIAAIGFILKLILEYRYKNKELKFKYFYELKAQKIIELYSKIVEIQMIVDRRKKDDSQTFESNMFKKRIALDKYYWESEFYFSNTTKNIFRDFLHWLPVFEIKDAMTESPEILSNFETITQALTREFKKEIN